MNVLLTLALLGLQSNPEDLKKADLPKSAMCAACALNGEAHGEERPAAGVRYAGKMFYFCNAAEVSEFKKDPEAFLPPVLPRPAPKFTAMSTTQGTPFSFADLKGKVVLVDFWATWCAPCVKVMPDLDKLHLKLADAGFSVVGVSIDEDSKKAIAFAAKRKFAYPLVLDDAKEPTWAAYGVRAIPAVFLIDRNGQVVAQWRGKIDPKAIAKAVEAEVAKKAS